MWDGENYTITLTNYEKTIVISDKNQVVPCLENAMKPEMDFLGGTGSDIPMVTYSKLCSTAALVRIACKQTQENYLSKSSKVNEAAVFASLYLMINAH